MNNSNTNKKSYKFWTRIAGLGNLAKHMSLELADCLQSKFGTYIMPNDTVLDFGCEGGSVTLLTARNVREVYGVDVSEGMLEVAQKQLKESTIENVTFLKIDTLNGVFSKEAFDVVTTFSVLQYIPNRRALFACFNEILKPKGYLILLVPCFREKKSFVSLLVSLLGALHIMPKTDFFSVSDFEKEIADAGFCIEESIDLSELPEKFIVARKI